MSALRIQGAISKNIDANKSLKVLGKLQLKKHLFYLVRAQNTDYLICPTIFSLFYPDFNTHALEEDRRKFKKADENKKSQTKIKKARQE